MTLAGWIILSLWVVGGFFVGLLLAVAEHRLAVQGDVDSPGLTFVAAWLFAPVVVAAAAAGGLIWGLGWIVERADSRLPLTRSQLQQKIAVLERELELDR